MSTGLPSQDAQDDFNRARRQRVIAQLAQWVRREPTDVDVMVPMEEVVAALGFVAERRIGLRTIALDSIVGTVNRSREFDRHFRPTSGRSRTRWERIAMAERRGEAMPPISVYRIGEVHFVEDGHHRVSVAFARGRTEIDAYVTQVVTKVPLDVGLRPGDLLLKSHERVFFERVPLPPEARRRITVSDPWSYAELAEAVEAWGFRYMQDRGELLSRAEVAERWFTEEYQSVVAMLRGAGLVSGTETESYMRIAAERYRLLRTHRWDKDIVARLARDLG